MFSGCGAGRITGLSILSPTAIGDSTGMAIVSTRSPGASTWRGADSHDTEAPHSESSDPEGSPGGPARSPRWDLRAILADGAAFSLMVGLGETYLAAFALALHMGEVAAGLVASVPMLAGGILQLATPRAVRWLGSHRRWVVSCAIAQAISLLVLPLAVVLGPHAAWMVFPAATLYWAAGLATGPAWNTWIEEIVPTHVRTRFFAQRVRISQLCVLVGFVIGGLLLEMGEASGWLLAVFAGLFLTAALCRLVSAFFLASQSEPSGGHLTRSHAGLREVIRHMRGHAGARLLVYLLAVQVGVQIAGPYFTPFMLSPAQLHFSYAQFMLLIGIAFLGKVVALPLWGRVAHYAGARTLLWIGGAAIVPVSGLWVVSHDFTFLVFVQMLSGLAWGAYELALFLMFFETIPRRERTSLLTIYNLGNAAALVAGALVGAALLSILGKSQDAYLTLFGLSTMARGAALVLLLRVPAVRFEPVAPALRVIAVRPGDGGVERPILPSLPNGTTASVADIAALTEPGAPTP
jgi:MFS family permease